MNERTDATSPPLEGATSTTTTAAPPEFLTVDEAAALLRVDRKSVYAAVKANQVPGVVRLGKLIRLRRHDLLSWGAPGAESARSKA